MIRELDKLLPLIKTNCMTNCLGQTTLISTGKKPTKLEVSYKKETTLGKVSDAQKFKRLTSSRVIYKAIRKEKKTVVFTSLASNLSYEMVNKTKVYVS